MELLKNVGLFIASIAAFILFSIVGGVVAILSTLGSLAVLGFGAIVVIVVAIKETFSRE